MDLVFSQIQLSNPSRTDLAAIAGADLFPCGFHTSGFKGMERLTWADPRKEEMIVANSFVNSSTQILAVAQYRG